MNAKEFLSRYYSATKHREVLCRELQEMRESIEDIKATDYEKVVVDGTKNPDVIGDLLASIEQIELRLTKAILQQHKAKAEVIEVISQVEDADVHDVLEKRFVQCKGWYQIEDEMYYSLRSLHRLKVQGYKAVEKILEERHGTDKEG